jgi:hypothetical protein
MMAAIGLLLVWTVRSTSKWLQRHASSACCNMCPEPAGATSEPLIQLCDLPVVLQPGLDSLGGSRQLPRAIQQLPSHVGSRVQRLLLPLCHACLGVLFATASRSAEGCVEVASNRCILHLVMIR